MATIEVRYFAVLREAAGVSKEYVETQAKTVGELYDELLPRYPFTLTKAHVKASLNGDWVDLNSDISNGDQVVFIPPVSGG